MTGWEFGQMIALAVAELSALITFFWFFMKRDWIIAIPLLLVFGIFRWVFNREAKRLRKKYDCLGGDL
jgi:Flp pilus assembly protein TadB